MRKEELAVRYNGRLCGASCISYFSRYVTRFLTKHIEDMFVLTHSSRVSPSGESWTVPGVVRCGTKVRAPGEWLSVGGTPRMDVFFQELQSGRPAS